MKIHLHDDTPAKPGEKHGPEGPTHCASVNIDYEYQAEMWVKDIEVDSPEIVRVDAPDLGREWKRDPDTKKFIEQNRKV